MSIPKRILHGIWLALALAAAGVFAGCQSGASAIKQQPLRPSGGFTAQDALRDLANLAPPADVDPEVFAGLKDSLAAMLAARPQQRFTAAVPVGDAGKVLDLTMYSNGDGSATCGWTYVNCGDYDLNSQVTINDLTPVGQYYHRKAGHPLWPLAQVADGDLNGEVNINDLTPLGQNLGNTIEGYRLQSSATGAPADPWTAVVDVPFTSSSVQAIGGPRRFSYVLAGAVLGAYYRVVPLQGLSQGEPSSPVLYAGDPVPSFTVSGACADHAGTGLDAVNLALDGQPDALTGAGGAFSFGGMAAGYLGYLTASKGTLTVLPQQRVVQVQAANVTGADFTAFAADRVAHNLPAEANAGQAIALTLSAVDAAGTALDGFSTEAELVIGAPDSVVTKPGLSVTSAGRTISAASGAIRLPLIFTDGEAQAELAFSAAGPYSVAVSGLGEVLDGELGQVAVTALDAPDLSIATWRHGADAAISLTFDDGSPDHWNRGMALWEEYGFRVTLGILVSKFDAAPERLPQLQQAFDTGHELANHTATHRDLTTLTKAEVRAELQTCQDFLQTNVQGLDHVLTVIYPYLAFNDDVISVVQEMGYRFARSGPQDMVEVTALNDAWNPPLYHLYSWANLNNLPEWMWDDTVTKAVNTGNWLVEQCHGIGAVGETGVGWSPQPESAFREHYDYIKSYGDRVWVAPLSEVGRYLLERNQAQFNVVSFTGDELSFILYDAYDDAVFDIPLTVMLEQPAGWSSVGVEQGLAMVPVELKDGHFLFDVAPGGGVVRVKRES